MKKNALKKIEEEIKKSRQISREAKNQILNKVFVNLLMAISVIVYFLLLILGFIYIEKQIAIICYKIISLLILAVTIIIFEKSYNKENGYLAINGIEFLIFSIITLFVPYIFFKSSFSNRVYTQMIGIYISIYYLLKSIIIYKYEKKKFLKEINDIKDIIKKDSIKPNKHQETIKNTFKKKSKELKKSIKRNQKGKNDKNNNEHKVKVKSIKVGRPKKEVKKENKTVSKSNVNNVKTSSKTNVKKKKGENNK